VEVSVSAGVGDGLDRIPKPPSVCGVGVGVAWAAFTGFAAEGAIVTTVPGGRFGSRAALPVPTGGPPVRVTPLGPIRV
jgi:hypothetical protein